jgi:hypothetical protein
MGLWKKILVIAGAIFLVCVAGFLLLNESLPSGTTGSEAEALAEKMLAAIGHEHWERTGAVSWTFRGVHHHLWDKQRHFARVRWDNYEVLVDLNRQTGIARREGAVLPPDEAAALVETAWKYWINDSFWLNPVSKIFDPGTTRQRISSNDQYDRLLVTYHSGGVTPGDSYLWIVDKNGLPAAWKMWVSIIPIGGVKISWENWITLSTGVKIATFHKHALFEIPLTNIRGAATLAELEPGEDPFAALEK